MILVLYIECTTTKILLLLKGSHHEPSKQSDENRASKRAREWQHHKKKNLVPCKAFLIRVRSSSSMGMVCWGERMSVPKKWALVLSSLALRGYIWKSFAWGSFWVLDPVGSPPHTLGHSPRNLRVAAVPPLLTNLSSRHISQAHTTAVCLLISQSFFCKVRIIKKNCNQKKLK